MRESWENKGVRERSERGGAGRAFRNPGRQPVRRPLARCGRYSFSAPQGSDFCARPQNGVLHHRPLPHPCPGPDHADAPSTRAPGAMTRRSGRSSPASRGRARRSAGKRAGGRRARRSRWTRRYSSRVPRSRQSPSSMRTPPSLRPARIMSRKIGMTETTSPGGMRSRKAGSTR